MTARRAWCAALAGASLAASVATAVGAGPAVAQPPAGPVARVAAQGTAVPVVVRAAPGAVPAAQAAVARLGGRVGRPLPVISGFAADLPAAALDALRGLPGVLGVTPDARMTPKTYQPALGYDPATSFGSMYGVQAITGAQTAFQSGWTGKGVGVALIDSGVAPVAGLTSGNVVNGPDLSFDSQEAALLHNDGFGHGTHMASIIAGRDVAQSRPANYVDQTRFVGMAPDATLVNIKVGAADGGTDVSQVLAAINWVVEHRNDPGLNIRVLNLSYGTDSTQPYGSDPLSYAVEAAWRAGIVVVVAGGNDGNTNPNLGMPAQNPTVIAVGAADPMGTLATSDDTVPPWASKGSTQMNIGRHVDLIAPGVSVLGLRVPNSSIDQAYPGARTGSRFLRGNGTSQSTAVVSGAVALFLQKFPTATPDQVKKVMLNQTSNVAAPQVYRGAGELNVKWMLSISKLPTSSSQGYDAASGGGSLESSRGSTHVVSYADDTTPTPISLTGETDVFGRPFASAAWTEATGARRTWSDGFWSPFGTGDWSGSSWAGRTWSGRTWSGLDWAGRTWSGRTWSGRTWSGDSWDGRTWSGRTWSGDSWSGRTWSGVTWQ